MNKTTVYVYATDQAPVGESWVTLPTGGDRMDVCTLFTLKPLASESRIISSDVGVEHKGILPDTLHVVWLCPGEFGFGICVGVFTSSEEAESCRELLRKKIRRSTQTVITRLYV